MREEKKERAHVSITGRVQGVFFRDSARQKAEELGLSGWVRNAPNGGVEAVFEGPSDKVREIVGWCEQGPPDAAVENVDADFEQPEDGLTGFEVR